MIRPDRRARPRWIVLALAVAAVSYLLLLGATWRGVSDPVVARFSLVVIGAGGTVWIALRRGPWPRTAFDRVLWIWLAALALSGLANAARWPTILTGTWFAAVYIVVWYALQDLLGGGLITRQRLSAVLLTAGIPVLISALWDAIQPPPGRISGALENANTLGGFLALILPLILAHLIASRGWRRGLLAVYLLIAALALLLTESRGAMLAVATALLVVGLTRARRPAARAALMVVYGATAIALISARGDSGRLPIYTDVAATFLEHPLTGTGLFTYRLNPDEILPPSGVLPGGTNLYAHNLILHVAVELGLPGLVALVLSVYTPFRHQPDGSDPLRLWAYASLIGAGAHQMVDFPLMMPGLALTGIAVLSLALLPGAAARSDRPARWVAALALALWLVGMLLAPLRA